MSKSHNIRLFLLNFAGIPIAQSGDGEFVSGTPAPAGTHITGNDGETTFSVSPDRTMEIVVNTLASSDAYAALSAVWDLQQLAADTDPTYRGLPLTVTNLANGTTFATANAWIMQTPGPDGARDAQVLQWTVVLTDTRIAYGTALPAKDIFRDFLNTI